MGLTRALNVHLSPRAAGACVKRPVEYERLYLSFYKVADTPFHIQGAVYIRFSATFKSNQMCLKFINQIVVDAHLFKY